MVIDFGTGRRMKRYLIPIIIILVLTSMLVVGCGFIGVTPEKQSVEELKSYVNDALPIMKRHAETTEKTNQANRVFLETYASGDLQKITGALTDYKNTLEWAVNRVDSTLLDFKKLLPSSEVRTYHSLMIEALTKEQYGLTKQLSYYSSVLLYGSGNDTELDDGNALLLEAQKIWLQAQYEFQDLLDKIGE